MFKISRNLSLPAEAITETFAILARRGAGKTYLASVLAENFLEHGIPLVWLDPLGVAWGLRTGYPIAIIGGDHADIELEPQAGTKIADILISERIPAILDVSQFGENEMKRFVSDFADRFYRKNKEAVHLFLDEADEFAPQGGSSSSAKCTGAIQNIVRRGRAKGIGVTMITQRSAVLHKSILSQTEGLFAMQTTHPRDLKAIEEWIGYHIEDKEQQKRVMRSIPKLQQGEAYYYSPGWMKQFKKIKVRKRKTFDSSATPKPGEKIKPGTSLKEIDLDGLRKSLAESRAVRGTPATTQSEFIQNQKHSELVKSLKKENLTLKAENKKLRVALEKGLMLIDKTNVEARNLLDLCHIERPQGVSKPEKVKGASDRVVKDEINGALLPRAQHKILAAFYWLQDEKITPAKVGHYSGYKHGSGSFNNALSALRGIGYLSGWSITDTGLQFIAPHVEVRPTGAELREWLRPKLGRAQNILLDVLIDHYPNRISVEDLAVESGYKFGSGSFNNALSKLRTLDAVEGGAREGGVIASEVYFY